MKRFRPAAERGHVRNDWLDSRHGFSFGHYHDPEWMGWGPLRVFNEDRVAPGGGFATHGHANMEILSCVLSGALAHRDSGGNEGVVHAGQWQWMSAGHGIEHSEYNASDSEPVHFLQIWIQPDRVNARPAHAQRGFDVDTRRGQWTTYVSPDGSDGSDGSLAIRQQAWVRGIALADGQAANVAMQASRRYWLQVVAGALVAGDMRMAAGDAVGMHGELESLNLVGEGDQVADVLLFDLPE